MGSLRAPSSAVPLLLGRKIRFPLPPAAGANVSRCMRPSHMRWFWCETRPPAARLAQAASLGTMANSLQEPEKGQMWPRSKPAVAAVWGAIGDWQVITLPPLEQHGVPQQGLIPWRPLSKWDRMIVITQTNKRCEISFGQWAVILPMYCNYANIHHFVTGECIGYCWDRLMLSTICHNRNDFHMGNDGFGWHERRVNSIIPFCVTSWEVASSNCSITLCITKLED